ncbi:UNKNOWN [Stylonychia lemnae]|uniref:Uncharacterized protein n=1 Tax=Stylonychia lemnae TaxID=5949 RepID=A0A078AFD3_STYLE|nr:UNKNOWN [Stylonychia lemnae]|eukprot:CDW79633.1 UNKNOWN [Stylonychia lemnae]
MQAVDLILQASRTSGSDGLQLTESWISGLSGNGMMYIRIVTNLLSTTLTGYSLFKWGIAGFPWFMSDWAAFTSVLVQLMLLWSHTRAYDPLYDNLVKAIFEIVFPFNMMTTLLYWTTYYEGQMTSDWTTWVYPLFMHAVPAATLLVEYFTNNIIFDWERGAARTLWAILSYIPLSYFVKDIWGNWAYSFITWDSWTSHTWVIAVVAINQIFFYAFSFLNNYIKTGQGVSREQLAQIPAQFENILKVAGI